jgi:hypothetical protein
MRALRRRQRSPSFLETPAAATAAGKHAEEFDGSVPLWQTLQKVAACARSIEILSAYYSPDFLPELCRGVETKALRKACRVRMVFNAFAGTMFTQQVT